jgi:hypothetical protein
MIFLFARIHFCKKIIIPVLNMHMRFFLSFCLLMTTLFCTAQPTISSFSPLTAKVGSTLTIKGSGFASADSNRFVFLGPVKATIVAATDTSLTVTIPKAATICKISVTINKLTAFSAKSFVPFYETKDSVSASQFSLSRNLNTTLNTVRLTTGDFNTDGYVDIIVTDPKAGLYTILKNNKVDTGSVIPQFTHKDISTDKRIYAAATGDLDGDGKQDIVFALSKLDSIFVAVLKNTSTKDSISFQLIQEIIVGNSASTETQIVLHVFMNDLDKDGKLDIITQLSSPAFPSLPAKIVVFKNETANGILNNNSFNNRINVTSPVSIKSFTVADLNGDARSELVGFGADSAIHIFTNTSTTGQISSTSFANRVKLPSSFFYISSIYVEDLDMDGKPEILLLGYNENKLFISRNLVEQGILTTSSFDAQFSITTREGPLSLACFDFTGNGKPDIVITSGNSSAVAFFENKSTIGTLNSSSFLARGSLSASVNASAAVITDFNNDGGADIAVGSNNLGFLIAFLMSKPESNNQPGISAKNVPVISSFSPAFGPAGATVTISGKHFNDTSTKNIVYFGAVRANIISATSTQLVVTVPVSGSYEPITVITRGLSTSSNVPFVVTAFTPDQKTITTNSFGNAKYFTTSGSSPRSVLTEDLNNDGKPEVIVTNQASNQVSIFRNLSVSNNDTLSLPSLFAGGTGTYGLATGDLNGDGKKEIVISNFNAGSSSSISVFPNTSTDSSITFGAKFDSAVGNGSTSVIIRDINMDGKADLIAVSGNSSLIHYFLNTGTNGNFGFAQGKTINLIPFRADNISLADMNGDGKPDIVTTFANTSSGIRVLLNTSDSLQVSFNQTKNYTIGMALPLKTITPDIDMDGKPDAAFGFAGTANIYLYRNSSTKDSLKLDSMLIVSTTANSGSFHFADMDGDGKPDLIVPDRDSNTVSVYPNRTTPNGFLFGNKISFPVSLDPATAYGSDINGDGMPEIITANNQSGNIAILRNKVRNPKIASFTPTSSKRLDTVLIKGSNFTRTNSVKAGGADMAFTVLSDTLIRFIANKGTNSGVISVTNPYGTDTMGPFTYIAVPRMLSFTPKNGGYGDTIIISGYHFNNASAVSFGDSAALSFQVVSDSLIKAVVNKGRTGLVTVKHTNGNDSTNGFTFNPPAINIPNLNLGLGFTAIKTVTTASQSYKISGRYLQGDIQVTAPANYQVSLNAGSGYAQQLLLSPVKNKIDSTTIYIRYKNDSALGIFSDTLKHSTVNGNSINIPLLASVCDSTILFKPVINTITVDSSVICYKDSLTLSVTNGSSFSRYRWSNGDTTKTIRIGATQKISVRVGNVTSCLSLPSYTSNFVKNTNTAPSLGLMKDSILISTTAPHYRWYFNNLRTNGDSSSTLVARKIGFYRVETSNDKLCWDASPEVPIVVLPRLATTDTAVVRVFPNPVTGGTFNVIVTLPRVTNVIARVTVTDANGIVLIQTNKFIFFGKEIKIPVTLSTYKGPAFVRVETNGDVEVQSIVLQ